MKRLLLLTALGLFFGLGSTMAQIEVTVRPAIPHYARVVQPSPRHVWIDEEWEPRGGSYVFVGGHWAEPPHPGWMWVGGHWARRGRGEVWVAGHWRRRD